MTKTQIKQPATVSIVVPVYNASSFLDECIQSVISQTISEFELILVDDGSTDDSLDIARRFASNDTRIQVLQHPDCVNRGVSLTRNLGLCEATGEFVAFLDADDEFFPDKLEKQVRQLRNNPNVVLCHTGIAVLNANPDPGDQVVENYHNNFLANSGTYRYQDREAFLMANGICNSSVVARRSILSKITYGHPQLFQVEDFVMWVLMAEHGQFAFISEPLTGYRRHAAAYSATANEDPLKVAFGKIELLLCVLAFAKSPEVITRAENLLGPALQKATGIYSSHHGMTIPPNRLDPVARDFAATFWKARAQHLESRIMTLRNPLNIVKELWRRVSL